MVRLLAFLFVLALSIPTTAIDLGNRAPDKPVSTVTPSAPDPDTIRQGGDTIADAVDIVSPYYGTGTTVGYTDDYDEVCPYSNSTSPDVVYRFTASGYGIVWIDLYGSSYDTKVYVYDENLDLVGCNDDYYPDYTSRLGLPDVPAGLYYIVIDGYGGDAGEYSLCVESIDLPIVECPPGSLMEDEPPLEDGYVDSHNGGCDSLDDLGHAPFQFIGGRYFCGAAGWYERDGSSWRDTDWFIITLPATGSLTITADAEWETAMCELGPQDCEEVGVIQSVEFGPYMPRTMTVTGEPGATVWLWVGSTTFEPPGGWDENEYLYVLDIPDVVAVEQWSWSGVKSLYR